jgi:uracil-DNA glycosylase
MRKPRQTTDRALQDALGEARACRLCEAHLPLGPRPVLRGSASARLLIVGQAPGTRVHASGIPWDDPSGERLRDWLGLERDRFYDEQSVAILPMGLCYPGRSSRGGDLPPRPECAPHWHPRVRPLLAAVRLTLLVGAHAQAYYLERRRKDSLEDTVRAFRDYLPDFFTLPHPSWRVNFWLQRNPWYAARVVPELRARVAAALGE